MVSSVAEENYIKAIYLLNEGSDGSGVSTNALSEQLHNKAASVTEMLRRLSEKKLINYQKYKGVLLTAKGEKLALKIIRKHRLWETFLVQKLKYGWEEVHDIAEQLEHIHSEDLIDRLSVFLGDPKFDPHGDPIPDAEGNFSVSRFKTLTEINHKGTYVFSGVTEHSKSFLQHLTAIGLKIGDKIKVEEVIDFDHSLKVTLKGKEQFFSNRVAAHILVEVKK